MDYEVFILSRIREEYDAAGSTGQAVISGIGRTGRLVTSAALILFLAFLALSATRVRSGSAGGGYLGGGHPSSPGRGQSASTVTPITALAPPFMAFAARFLPEPAGEFLVAASRSAACRSSYT
jgi:uncharacterized membrane protein YdfJ with MMPL/SSD domain